jgi:predicted Zn-dependent protease
MRTREVRRARMIAALAGVAMLAACQGHGKYTAEGVTAAERRMAALKAATEFDMAEQALRSGELDKAERKIEVALALAPDVRDELRPCSPRVRVEQGRIGDALAALERSLELDPERAETHYYLGIVSETPAPSG